MRVLHLGCGRRGTSVPFPEIDAEVTTLDADPLLSPDILCRLGEDPIPRPDDSFDRAVAIHVLEHIGRQGETKEWFQFWEELYRVLKPDGQLEFISPLPGSVWAWADPSHTRAVCPQSFVFFNQNSYRKSDSSMSPFRVKCDFEPVTFEGLPDVNEQIRKVEGISHFRGVLKAVKPLKPWWEALS